MVKRNYTPKPRWKAWRGLVDYANATPQELCKDTDRFLAIIYTCLSQAALLTTAGDAYESTQDEQDRIAIFRTQLIGYQPELRRLFRFMCRWARGVDAETEAWAVRFLNEHAYCARRWISEPVLTPADYLECGVITEHSPLARKKRKRPPLLPILPPLFARYESFPHMIDPVCCLILSEQERWHSGQLVGVEQTFPIRECARDGCDRFLLARRPKRAMYCSDRCRALANRKSKAAMRKYMRDYRRKLALIRKAREGKAKEKSS